MLFLFSINSDFAQTSGQIAFGANLGNYVGADFRINLQTRDKLSFGLGICGVSRNYTGIGTRPNHSGRTKYVRQRVRSLEFLVGKIIPQDIKKRSKLNIKAGIVLSKIITPNRWESKRISFFPTIYSMSYSVQNTIGIILEPSMEMFVSKHRLISLAPFVFLTGPVSAFGFNVQLIFGREL